jgi:carbon storage regulator CsrA
MLVLNRKEGEKIFIGADVTITLVSTRSDGTAKIGIDAPASTPIYRDDVAPEGFKPYASPPIPPIPRKPKQRRR